MGYRIGEKKPHKPNRTMQDVATPSDIFIVNGETSRLAIPCWYYIIDPPIEAHPHSRMHHDHVGWPSPNHPDHICQRWDFAHSCCGYDMHKHVCDHCHMYLDMDTMAPIHLTREGYTNAYISFDENISGLTSDCYIDEKEDWVIRVNLKAKCEKAIKEKQRIRFTVFVSNGSDIIDIASTGFLTILPGPYA